MLEEDMHFPAEDDELRVNSEASHVFEDKPLSAEPEVKKKIPKSEYNLYLQDDSFSDGSRT